MNQGTSYELVLEFILCALAGIGGLFTLADISYSQSNVFFVFYFFFFAGLTKTNRQPFNLAEAEFEPFFCYNIKYASGLLSPSEYVCILLMSALQAVLFFSGRPHTIAYIGP